MLACYICQLPTCNVSEATTSVCLHAASVSYQRVTFLRQQLLYACMLHQASFNYPAQRPRRHRSSCPCMLLLASTGLNDFWDDTCPYTRTLCTAETHLKAARHRTYSNFGAKQRNMLIHSIVYSPNRSIFHHRLAPRCFPETAPLYIIIGK